MCEVTPGICARDSGSPGQMETLKYFELILAREIVANLVFLHATRKTGCEKEFRNLGVLFAKCNNRDT
jgi:hypothetical protein